MEPFSTTIIFIIVSVVTMGNMSYGRQNVYDVIFLQTCVPVVTYVCFG